MIYRNILAAFFCSIALSSCVVPAKVFLTNQTGETITVNVKNKSQTLIYGASSKRYTYPRAPTTIQIEVGNCIYKYNPDDFNQLFTEETKAKHKQYIFLYEFVVEADGTLREYSYDKKNKSRTYEIKRQGGDIQPAKYCL